MVKQISQSKESPFKITAKDLPQYAAPEEEPTPTPTPTPAPKPVDDIQKSLERAKQTALDIQRKVVELSEKKGETAVAEQGREVLEAVEAGEAVPTFEVPESKADKATTATSTAEATATATESFYEKERAKKEKAAEEAETEATEKKKEMGKLWKKYLGVGEEERVSTEEILTEKFKEWGVSEAYEDIRAATESMAPLRDKLANLEKQKERDLERNEARKASMATIERRATEIEKEYDKQKADVAAQLQAKAAQVQALQGNISVARGIASDFVDAASYDEEMRYNQIRDFIDYNRDIYDDLKQDERDLLDDAYNLRLLEYENKQTNLSAIRDWMIDYPEQFTGVNPSKLTMDEATELARKGAAIREAEEGDGVTEDEIMSMWDINQFTKSYGWTPPYGFTKNQIIQYQKDNPNATPAELERGAKQALVGEETEIGKEFLNKQYFRDNFTEDELKEAAKNKRGFLGFFKGKVGEEEVDEFLTKLTELVQSLRDEGYSDDEILESIKNNELKVE